MFLLLLLLLLFKQVVPSLPVLCRYGYQVLKPVQLFLGELDTSFSGTLPQAPLSDLWKRLFFPPRAKTRPLHQSHCALREQDLMKDKNTHRNFSLALIRNGIKISLKNNFQALPLRAKCIQNSTTKVVNNFVRKKN